MPKARTSLVFKGPANPSGRVRKPPSIVTSATTTVVKRKKKPTVSLRLSDDDDNDDGVLSTKVVSEKAKGKRKAIARERDDEDPQTSYCPKVVYYESSTALSTVEKTWKPLSDSSKKELSAVAKEVESEMRSRLPTGMSKSDFKTLVANYLNAFMDDLENVDLPPFPSNLKSRTGSTSKDTIELLDAAFVKQKIEATRASLAKEDEKIRQLEAELKSLKRNSARREAEISEDEVARSSPVKKKKKKAVTIESKPSSPSTKKTKSSSRPVAATKSKVASKSILKPPPPPAQAEAGEDLDDFDTFPLPPKHVKPKVATQAPRKRPSLAGKQSLEMNPYDQTNPHQMDRHDGYDWSFPAQQYPGGYVQPSAHEHNSLFAVPSQAALKPAFNFASGQPLQQGAPQLSSPSGMQHLQGEEATLTAAMDQAQTRWEGLSKELEGIQKELDCEITDAERRRLNKRYNTLDRQIAIAQQEYGLNKRELDKLRRDPSSRAIQATNPYLQHRARLRKVIDDEVKARSEAASREEKGVNSNSYRKHSKRVTRAKNDYWRFMEAHNWVDDDDTLLRKMKETDSKERTKGPARKP
ncbi:hypothetical protein JCM3766R1_004714 [Sporobolomyces carnicolor]